MVNMGLEEIQDMTQKGKMSVKSRKIEQWMDLKRHLMLVSREQQAMDITS